MDTFAKQKLAAKNLDLMVGNLIGAPDSGFGADTNRVVFYFRDGTHEAIDLMPKAELAHLLLDRIAGLIGPNGHMP